MYLKTLYIQGFKSFAQKTKIEFNNKITGIVGPNGSGKSNISDAMMWVLGETSIKSLRGSKMEDVIFSGTDEKKPLGFAEVTIVFDNSDKKLPIEYTEVSVTRRMYRSLESEFLINNVKCRLKDIKELFMDTGIGKDGYSLIGQGKIESILSNKPEQRRSVFEEAAGISKFKMRKLESENKLRKTEENLIRLNDIISEIEIREKVLKVESENAIRYKNFFNKLTDLEVTLAFVDIEKQKLSEDKFNEKIAFINGEIENINLSIKINQDEQQNVEEKIRIIEEEIESIQLSEIENNKNYERMLSQIELISEKKLNINSNVEQRNTNIFELENLILQNREKYNTNIEKINTCNDDFVKVTEQLSKLKKDLDLNILEFKKVEDKIETDSKILLELHKNKSEIESKQLMTQSIISEKESRLLSVSKNLDLLKENNIEIEKEFSFIDIKYNDILNRKSQLIVDKEKLEKEILELNNKIKNSSKLLSEYKNKYDKKNAEFIALKNIADNYEGYSKSVKFFMNGAKKRNIFSNSLIGPVAENLRVDSKYEKAISVALGGNLQNIIVKSDSDAKEMIEFLNREKYGRVTFLPINSMTYKEIDFKLKDLNEEGLIGFADELIEFDCKYKSIFKNLLGKIIISKDFDTANRISKKLNRTYRVVTLDGDSLNIGGSITGGSILKNNTDIISRKSDIEKLERESLDLKDKYESILKEYDELKSKIEDDSNLLNELKNEIYMIFSEIVTLENSKNNLSLSKNSNDAYLSKYVEEKNQLMSSITLDKDLLTELDNNLKNIDFQLKEKNISGNTFDKEHDTLKLLIEEQREEYSKNQLDSIKIQGNIDSLIKENNNILSNNEFNNLKITNLNSEIVSLELDRENLNIEENKLNEKLINSKDILDKTKEALFELRESKLSLNLDLKKYRNIFEQLQIKLIDFEKRNAKILSEKDKIEFNILNIEEKIKIEYGIEADNIKKLVDYKNLKEIKDEIFDLKVSISKLGDINLFSIEEYKAVSERLRFNLEQKQDLLDSREEIKSILKELDKEMKEKFRETFSKVSKYFEEIFKILFNGGKAQIEIDGDDELYSGIEIKAQPPGKRFQSLSLLSGGERALTAVALLFALLKVKTAPFCILDEIDAALDDANVKRYVDYLIKIENIQFIIITHRKLTMEIANILYGVTMEEKGISKIISVELKN
ncbi:chromosome segregation protein SMC [Peptoniphilus mikwangii]|uniref:chromosome segregation protein SMC n=1 Tax=Peptoniphilus mikwangii TaxID=1354300 RepID=UPI00042979B8|nr:chromosome segregation protein SMC [Peptoniphilus mikwangii]